MKLLTNPVVLHSVVVLFCASFAFLLGMMFMRLLRKSIQEEADISSESPTLETLPLHVYNTVIRQLKQQQDELKVQAQADQQKFRSSENFNQVVLANLSCGVLSVGKNGLVKSSNTAAKQILGFASPIGMSVKDIFREAVLANEAQESSISAEVIPEPAPVADEIDCALLDGDECREIQAEYQTPSGEQHFLSITIAPVHGSDGAVNGAACLIQDITELSRLRHRFARGDAPMSTEKPAQANVASAGA